MIERRFSLPVRLALAGLVLVAAAFACGPKGAVTSVNGTAPVPGLGLGAACDATHACRAGLACSGGTCQSCQCTAGGASCTINDECAAGSYCGPARTCVAGGSGMDGAACQSDADCGSGLRCDIVGFAAKCKAEGMVDVGGSCTTASDCLGGLTCAAGSCQPSPHLPGGGVPIAMPDWPGEVCHDDAGPTQAYFRVPRGTNDGDFYRLPFPNDVRLSAGKISLAGHPTPGTGLLGYDVVDRYLRDLEQSADGFSAYPTVLFRFSAPVDLGGTLKQNGTVRWVDVTDPQKANDLGLNWYGTTDRNAYICNNWIGVRPQMGVPLKPGHTYAVLITTTALDAHGNAIQGSPDLAALLAPSAPSDPTLSAEWPKYQPLRDWAALGTSVPVSSILNATVFTVGHAQSIGPKLAAAVAAAPAPTASGWVRCGDAPSPCPQATGDRACGAPDPAFDELHALITLPIFQRGTEPYATPADGGDIALGADGTPQMQTMESVCMALTVPKAAMPAGGWPLLVYAHGTGGSFRSQVGEGVAKRLSLLGGQLPAAVLGIDQVEHGTRRGSSTDTPDDLFFNYANPLAARGNPLQGAADQMALARFASTFDLPAAQSPTGAEIKAGRVAFWGHSQGATEGGIAMPYTAGILGAVLSGEGASLIDGLLGKKNPVDIADGLPVVLEDIGKVGQQHPVLALLQNDFDADDPLNHAPFLVASPVAPANQKHVFQPYGQGDTYAPTATQRTFALSAQLAEASAPGGVTPDPIGAPAMAAPVSGNAMVGGVPITAIVRQYAPDATYDGHFVAYDNPTASADVDRFLLGVLSGTVPAVGP